MADKIIGNNLITYPFYETTKTLNGITFTDNHDGTITVDGTSTSDGDTSFYIEHCWIYSESSQIPIDDGKSYKLTGAPIGCSYSTVFLQAVKSRSTDTTHRYNAETGSGTTITPESGFDHIALRIVVKAGVTVENVTFNPQLFEIASGMDRYNVIGDPDLAPQVPDTPLPTNWKSLLHPVGTIIHSATCDTMAKVIEAYGGTTWIQHSGYVLRGATSGVVANSAVKSGGNDNAVVVSHNHGGATTTGGEHEHHVGSPSYHIWGVNWASSGGGNFVNFGFNPTLVNGDATYGDRTLFAHSVANSIYSSHSHVINSQGEDGTGKNIPNFKAVYIWERTA